MNDLKHLPIVFDAKAVKDDGSFEGYASVFNNVDQGNDIVLPGAFTKSLQDRPAGRVKMLWQHRPDEPIGVWTSLVEDGHGLKAYGTINPDVQRGREAISLMKMGAVDGLSIGFRTKEADYEPKTGVRKLKQLDLHEISLVTFPMNDRATVTRVKEFNPRELERGLRDAGLSRGDAVKAVAYFRDRLREAGENVEIDPREAEAATQGAEMAAVRKLIEAMR
ncbi:HK97 family phage prohead protease [Methylocystis sp. JR02]|uniref:HK97 family phage prohead protease n=1 Tax=Methylocystis sp. JR02 TaxID=3046284 RepID=UPI0024B8CBCA|nr:HK97 family phage prohead protease [Methylocystis sp. JR02]MDJ0449236.1 HK97 family phage prohead protease [Methylocystis sp. JR02]